jgi:Tol biopolymer transport system component
MQNNKTRFKLWLYWASLLSISFALVVSTILLNNYRLKLTPTPALELDCGWKIFRNPNIGSNRIAFNTLTNWNNFGICVVTSTSSYIVTKNGRNNYVQAWSPDNKQLVFESGEGWKTNVYMINVDGTGEKQVNQTDGAIGGDWSPDGKRILYAEGSSPYDYHIVNVDGTNETKLPPLDNGNSRARWSPDGNKLVFWSANGKGIQISTANIDGTNSVTLTSNGYNSDPAWSPDGKHIVFSSDRDYVHPPTPISPADQLMTGTPLQGVYQIYIMDADGSNIRKLTSNGNNFRPSWSPDGTKIAFERRGENDSQIFIMDADGTNIVQLTQIGYNFGPVWSH